MNAIVTTRSLTKHYGRIRAVEDLSLEIPEKSVFGILGPNGSGKTTTLGMLLDVINPTSGTYSWFGNLSKKENRQKIGSILEKPAFYPYLSAVDNLKIVAEIRETGYGQIDELLGLVGLHERRFTPYHTFSLGMKQRLALASALLGDPWVMILDEPTNGLDPQGIAEIRELIRKVAAQGKTIILASHLLDEVQKVCTHFAVLDRGKLVHAGPVNEADKEEIRVEVSAEDINSLASVLNGFSGKKSVEKTGSLLVVTLSGNASVEHLSRHMYENGIIPTHLLSVRKSLESQFLEILNESK